MPDELVNVRYMVDDVEAAVAFYTAHFGFAVRTDAAPAFADVVRGQLRLLLSGPKSSAGRPMPDGRIPEAGGWNRIHLIVEDLAGEVERLRAAGLTFRNDVVSGPGGLQIVLDDPAGNPIELFQPAGDRPAPVAEPAAAALTLFAGIRVRDFAAAKRWYERLLGDVSFLPHATEAVWMIDDERAVYILEDADGAGHGLVTIFAGDLDAVVGEIAARGLEPDERETYANGVRKVIYRDPDGNEVGFGGAPVDDGQT